MLINGARIKECLKSMTNKEFAAEFDIDEEAAQQARDYYEQNNKSLRCCNIIGSAIARRKREEE